MGNPRRGDRCKPCYEFCNGHSKICFDVSLWNSTEKFTIDEESAWPHIQLSDWKTALTAKHGDLKGPSEETAVCANCEDHTTGLKCEHCKIGYFQFQTNLALKVRGEPKFTTHCLPCQCNGHGDICDEVSVTVNPIIPFPLLYFVT